MGGPSGETDARQTPVCSAEDEDPEKMMKKFKSYHKFGTILSTIANKED